MKTVSKSLSLQMGLSLVFFSGVSTAQNMQVIGENSWARACYEASSLASMTGIAGQDGIDQCDLAITRGQLVRKDLVATYVNRGVLEATAKNYAAAAKNYNHAIKLNSETGEAYLNRGNLWFISERHSEAIADYDKSLELQVGQAHVALLNRGMAREKLGKLELARSDYVQALAIREEWAVAEQKLARVSRKIDKMANPNSSENVE